MVALGLGLNMMPYYIHIMLNAAIQAKELGLKRVSAIEFGVAGGNGLVTMEEHAKEIEQYTGVKFDLYGFDSGTGLPITQDYRDQLYFWAQGGFPMDVNALKSRLKNAQLILGDVKETTKFFC